MEPINKVSSQVVGHSVVVWHQFSHFTQHFVLPFGNALKMMRCNFKELFSWSRLVVFYCINKICFLSHCVSLLAEVSYDEAKWNERRETSADFRQVVWWSRRPNFWSKPTGFQNRSRLMCNARALVDWTLTIIEPTLDCVFREFRNFSLWSSHKTA